jgi:hypothetical protein
MNGTRQDVRLVTDDQAVRLWAVVDEHAQVDGRCRGCGRVRRCPDGSAARVALILAGRWNERPV